MKIALCQYDIVWENKTANFDRAFKLLNGAQGIVRDALVLLPEMFCTGFSMNVPEIAEREARAGEKFLSETAQKFDATVVGGVVNLGKDGRGRNESVVYGPGGDEVSRYAKMQPFALGGEMAHYTPGSALKFFKCGGFTVAPFVCYDLRFPELFRMSAIQGAQLFAVIANWPVTRIEHWVTLLRARAIENQAYVAGVNRTGTDPRFVYSGRSILVDPHGQIIADAGDKDCVIGADIDVKTVENWRRDFPALADIREEFRTTR